MKNLNFKIEYLRKEMHKLVLDKGISHPDVLIASQKLDEAISEFYDAEMIEKAG